MAQQLAQRPHLHLQLFSSTTSRGPTMSSSSCLDTARLRLSTNATKVSKARPSSLSGLSPAVSSSDPAAG